MSNWKVSKQRIKLFPHPNADALELGKVGTYQVVVQKGLYNDGDQVVFVPEHSVLVGRLEQEFKPYLAGKEKNRVKSVMLRKELSSGIILSNQLVEAIARVPLSSITEDVDLSKLLGITKYIAPIPACLSGEVESIDATYRQHDCEQFGVYQSEFKQGEQVVVTEKLHGSQLIAHLSEDKSRFISSKGLLGRGLSLKESESNSYWQAANNVGLFELMDKHLGVLGDVQVFGELIPCQGGDWSYGHEQPTVKIFDIKVAQYSVPYSTLPEELQQLWVPILYTGPFDADLVRNLRQGTEQVSGNNLHIREGAVVHPQLHRKAADGTNLMLKIINPKYKQTGDEFN